MKRNRSIRRFARVLGIAILTGLASTARAQFTGSNQTNTISGVTSNWNNNYYVGNNLAFDALQVINNGHLTIQFYPKAVYVGYTSNASNNSILVSGSGSTLNDSGNMYVGYDGSSNQMVITAGGVSQVDYGNSTYVGYTTNANNNSILVSGSGSTLKARGDLYVGYDGSSNQMVITAGGVSQVNNSGSTYVGYTTNANGNSIMVSGSGSTLTNGSLYLGYRGGGNQMAVTAGGTVDSHIGFVGYLSGSNSLLVSGTGSTWRTAGLVVGTDYGDGGNSLVISNGGAVFGGGGGLTGSNNTAVVTGAGSVWSNNAVLFGGFHNQVNVTDGGTLYSGYGYVGSNTPPSAIGPSVLVSDAGSVWNNPGELDLGLIKGAGSSLTISNDGVVNSGTTYVGKDIYYHTSSNNSVLVTGNGSVWNNQGTIYVGFSGNVGNSVSINNGGKVVTSNMIVSARNLLSLNAGTLVAPGGLTISSNATLKGVGTIIGPTTINGGGMLSPGFSPGVLTFSNALTLAANATLQIELAGYGGSEFDQIIANGATVDGSILQLQLLGGFVPTNGAQFTILDNFSGGSIGGTFAVLAEGSTNDFGTGIEFSISYAGNGPSGGANDILLTVVPEPSTWVLLMLGCGCLRIMRRRWRSGG